MGGVSNTRADASTSLGPVSLFCENVVREENRSENHSVVTPPRGSYAAAARDLNVQPNVDPENVLPSRPLSVYFQPRYFLPARDVFEALSAVDLDTSAISCLQRHSSGAVILTFQRPEYKDRFLRRNVFHVHEQPYVIQDVDRPLTYLQIFDAPHELPDTAITARLSTFCDVVSSRRGYFREPGWENVHDGVRHYHVRIRSPLPSFLRFGKVLIHLRHNRQIRTCRHCHQPGHLAQSCSTSACFNCDQPGHLAANCPSPTLCHICKSPEHKANTFLGA